MSTPSSLLRRNATRSIAAVAAASLAVVGLAPAAVAQPTDDDVSGALAELIDLDALGLSVAEGIEVTSGNPSDEGPNYSDIDLGVLAALNVTIGDLTLPLISDGEAPGLIDLGYAGVLNGYAASETPSTSSAASGLVTETGAIDLDAVAGDPSGTDFARVDLTDLTAQLGVDLDGVVDEISLGLGALASSASQTTGGQPESDYVVAGADLVIDSPAVRDAVGLIDGEVDGVETSVNDLLGEDGPIQQVLDDVSTDPVELNLDLPLLPDLEVLTADLGSPTLQASVDLDAVTSGLLEEPLTDTGLVSIDLAEGLITVDLAQLHGSDLNDLGPNTSLLTSEQIDQITAEIAALLGDVAGTVTDAVDEALLGTNVTITLNPEISAALGAVSGNVSITIDGSLGAFIGQSEDDLEFDIGGGLTVGIVTIPIGELLGELTGPIIEGLLPGIGSALEPILDEGGEELTSLVSGITSDLVTTLDPLFDTLPALVSVTINEQPTEAPINGEGDLGPDSFTVRALAIDLLPGVAGGVPLNLASSSVRVLQVDPDLTASPDFVPVGEEVTTVGTDFVPESTVTVEYTDSTGESLGSFEGVPVGEDGTFEHTFAVPADTPAGELTVLATDDDAPGVSASDTVTVVDASIGVSPEEVELGQDVTVEGEGYAPGEPVTVVFEDADGNTWTESVEADDDGGFTLDWPVPADAALGELGVTATGDDSGASARDTVEVVIVSSASASVEYDVVPQGGEQIGYGSGYAPGVEVTGAAGPAGDQTDLGTQTADEDGNVTFTWDIAGDADLGTHTFTLTAQNHEERSATYDVVETPTITASPDYVEPGDEVTVGGSDFRPGSTVTVEYTDSAGDSLGSFDGVPVGDDGTFDHGLVVPDDAATGELTIEATEDGAPGVSASDTVTVVDGSIVVSPDEVEPGENVTVEGDGFAPGESVTVTFEDSDGTTSSESVEAGDDGGFSLTWPVPDEAPLGDLNVAAEGEDSGTSALETAEVVAITGVDATVEYDVVAQGGEQVGYGSGYAPDTVVTAFAGPEGDLVELGTQSADEDGNVTFTWDLAEDAGLGTHTFTLAAERYEDASAEFEVMAQPVIDASPDYVETGEQINVEGSGFVPGSTVTVEYTDSDGGSWTNPGVEVGPEGTFTDTFDVSGEVAMGELIIVASDEDEASALSASDAVTVVDGSISVSPDEVEPGENVTVEGEGFAPGETVTVEFEDADGNTSTESVEVDDDGGFTLTWPVPDEAPLGDLDVAAEGGDSGTSASDAVEVVAISSVDISVKHDVVPQGGEQIGYGSGYAPDTVVTGTAGPEGNPVDLGTQTADEDGNVTFTWAIPEDTEVGTHTFELVADRYVDQLVEFDVVEQPVIEASPDQVEPGQVVTVEGSNFGAEESVQLVFNDAEDEAAGTATVSADEDGAFSTSLQLPVDVALGDLDVDATGDDTGWTASDSIAVVAISSVDISVEYDVVPQGGEQIGYGSGYAPGVEVTGAAGPAGDQTDLGTQTADEDGNITFTWDIAGDADLGTHTFTLTAERHEDQSVDYQVVVQPAVNTSPDYVEPGDEITVDGSDFDAGSTVTVEYTDSTGESIGSSEGIPVSGDGTFEHSLVVPDDAAPGELTVVATDDEAPAVSASDTVTVVDGSIGVSPDEVEPGQDVTVEGEGFAPGETVTVEFEDADGNTSTESVEVDDDGGFTVDWPVPGDAPLGGLDVVATGDDSGTSASETVEVVAISSVEIAVEYDQLPRLQEQIGYGSGYAPGTEVRGYTDTSPSIELGTEIADEDGNVTFTWVIPAEVEYDAYTFLLEADRYVDQSVTFQVVPPSIEVSPDEVEPGDTIVVEGEDFAPGESVTVEFEDSEGNTWTEEASAGDDGTFTLEWEVPTDAATGTLAITATAASGSATGTAEIVDATEVIAGPGAAGMTDRLPTAGLGGTPELLALAGLVLLAGIGMAVRATRRPALD